MMALSAPIDQNYSKLNYTAMKHFNLLKSLLLLCALIVGSLSSWADDYELVTSAPTDWTGDYVLVNECSASASTFLTDGTVTGNSFSTASAVKTLTQAGITYNSSTKKLTDVTDAYVLHVAPSSTSGKYYITLKGAKTTIYLIANSTTGSSSISTATATTNADWSISLGNNGNAYLVGKSGRYVGWNSTYFRAYASSNKDTYKCYLFRKSAAAAGTTSAPSIIGNTPFLTNTTVTISNDANSDGASIYYTLNGSAPTTTVSASCFEYSTPFTIDATTTVNAIAKKSTDANASSVVSQTFTKVEPISVPDALTAINALANNGTITGQCVRGIVSKVSSIKNGAITYSISDGGNTENELKVYRGVGLNNTEFSALSDIEAGDEVVIFGTLKKFYSSNTVTPEFDEGSYLLSIAQKTAPSFALDVTEKTLDAYTHETVDVTLTTNTDGDVTCESSNTDVATVALKSAGVYTITAQSEGSATITIKSATSATYKPASATVAITVEDGRADAGISFAETEIEKTWGESFTGQALSNTNSVDVTYSSTDESVATVSSTGVVTVLKAGSTTIKATFAGNATYKAYVASYDLTINKAEAGLSYSENTFDVVLGDKNFVAPVLNNPNGLTVTYSSNNTNVALVDENTGDVFLDASAEATVKITATFAGNDNFKTGSTNYTINIIDPNKKGSKLNPYTVAEVNSGSYSGNNYVTGYIVGFFNGKDKNASSSGNSNLALSDTPDEISGANTIAVQLQSGTLRTSWNIDDNNVIGYKVLVYGNITGYFTGKTGVKSPSQISAVSVPVSVSAAGWATYCSSNALDFTGVTALTAYTATKDGNVVKFNKVTGKVPAKTGLLVKGETANVPVCASAEPVENLLEGVTEETVKEANTVFVLMKGSKGIGFYKNTNDFTLRANSAYLRAEDVPTTDARAFIALDDETTGIADVKAVKEDAEGMFDLQGRKIAKPTKGLYIVNGKKIVVK